MGICCALLKTEEDYKREEMLKDIPEFDKNSYISENPSGTPEEDENDDAWGEIPQPRKAAGSGGGKHRTTSEDAAPQSSGGGIRIPGKIGKF